MNRRHVLTTIALASSSSLAACSEQYEQFMREREYPNINKDKIRKASKFASEAPNQHTELVDFRSESNATIYIKENIIHPTYNPNLIVITPETTVEWVNKIDPQKEKEYGKIYTVKGVSDGSINSNAIKVNESFTHTFTEEQVFTYKCEIYDNLNMQGAIIVSDSEPT